MLADIRSVVLRASTSKKRKKLIHWSTAAPERRELASSYGDTTWKSNCPHARAGVADAEDGSEGLLSYIP